MSKKKQYENKSPCNDIDCQYWAWKKNENKMCVKPKSEKCPLEKK